MEICYRILREVVEFFRVWKWIKGFSRYYLDRCLINLNKCLIRNFVVLEVFGVGFI